MESNKFLKIVKNYKKCPKCKVSWKTDDLQLELKEEIVHISCSCGFSKKVDENNQQVND